MITPDLVERVRQASDIVEVIGSYVPLKRSGKNHVGLSPFQKEKTPSFYVDALRQRFKCFSSGHGGDVFKFFMILENQTFPEVVRRLAQRAAIPIPEGKDGSFDKEAWSRKEQLRSVHAGVAAWWHQLLLEDPQAEPARAYLASRDFSLDLAKEFGLGYAPDGWDITQNWAKKKGFSLELLEACHLVGTSERGTKYDFFRGRLMIPIHDESGQVVAFSGRLLDTLAKAPKYVNSSETAIFTKSKILFGLNKTKKAILDADQVILCEGQIDLMRCWAAGVKNVVAPQGTALTDQHVRIIKRLAKEVLICFDADRAGQNAAEKSVDLLLGENLSVRVVQMPEGEDPDSLLRKKPVEVFMNLLKEAPEYTRYLLERACKEEDMTTPYGKGLVAAKMAVVLSKIPNSVQRESFLVEVASRLQVPRVAVEAELKKAAASAKQALAAKAAAAARAEAMKQGSTAQAPYHPEGEEPDLAGPGPLTPEEELEAHPDEPRGPMEVDPLAMTLLALLLDHPQLVSEATRRLNTLWLDGYPGSEMVAHLLEAHAADAWEDLNQYLGHVSERESDYLSGLMMDPPPMPEFNEVNKWNLDIYLSRIISNIQKRWARQRQLIVEQKIKMLEGDLMALFAELKELRGILAS